VDALNNLGIALGSSGDLEAAIDQFQKALAIDASSTDARRNLEMAEQALRQMQGQKR
jgi:tetratricopeptide (TPR) repeat protein